jgi:hypothetical protein
MEAAHEGEVVRVGSATVLPPHDVMGLGELPGAASREGALSIAVAELPNHPFRGVPGDPSETYRLTGPSSITIWMRPLHASRLVHLGMDGRIAFDLGAVQLTG